MFSIKLSTCEAVNTTSYLIIWIMNNYLNTSVESCTKRWGKTEENDVLYRCGRDGSLNWREHKKKTGIETCIQRLDDPKSFIELIVCFFLKQLQVVAVLC